MEELGVDLFMSLFEMYPKLLDLFPFKDNDGKPIIKELKVHGLKVVGTLGEVVQRLSNLEIFNRYITGLVERHFAYGVDQVHYDVVLDVLLAHLCKWEHEGERLSPEVCGAWARVFDVIKAIAKGLYAKRAADGAPAAS